MSKPYHKLDLVETNVETAPTSTADAARAVGVSTFAVESRVAAIERSGVMSQRRSGWVGVGRIMAPVVPGVVRADGWVNHATTLAKDYAVDRVHVADGGAEALSAAEQVSDVGVLESHEGGERAWVEQGESGSD